MRKEEIGYRGFSAYIDIQKADGVDTVERRCRMPVNT
jgi:hypothetical protein